MDSKDRVLVALLSRNARTTNRELAASVGLSPSSCLERVRRLEESGIILGYRAIVAPKASGVAAVEGWAGVHLLDPSPSVISCFLEALKKTEIIVEAYKVAGPYDYALRFISTSIDEWTRFQQELSDIGCEHHARISVLVSQLK